MKNERSWRNKKKKPDGAKKLKTEVDGADGQPIASTPIPLQRTSSSLSSCKQKKWNIGDCVQTNSASLIFISPPLPGRNARSLTGEPVGGALMWRGSREEQACDVLPLPSGPLTHPICSLKGETFPVSSFALPHVIHALLPPVSLGGGWGVLCFPPHSVTFKLQDALRGEVGFLFFLKKKKENHVRSSSERPHGLTPV